MSITYYCIRFSSTTGELWKYKTTHPERIYGVEDIIVHILLTLDPWQDRELQRINEPTFGTYFHVSTGDIWVVSMEDALSKFIFAMTNFIADPYAKDWVNTDFIWDPASTKRLPADSKTDMEYRPPEVVHAVALPDIDFPVYFEPYLVYIRKGSGRGNRDTVVREVFEALKVPMEEVTKLQPIPGMPLFVNSEEIFLYFRPRDGTTFFISFPPSYESLVYGVFIYDILGYYIIYLATDGQFVEKDWVEV